MHFGVHFPKENVQQRCAKMHLMQKCIFATHHILRSKMFSITFSKGKCSAVQKCCVFCFAKNKDAVQKMQRFLHHILFCKNAFLHQQNVTNAFDALQKYIFASHFVGAKMHFCKTKCYKCI